MNDARTLADVQAICEMGDLKGVWHYTMLKRLAALNTPSLGAAKRIIRARFGRACAPQALARAIREERGKFLQSERAKVFSSKTVSNSGPKLSYKRTALAAAFGRLGGMTRCAKGFARMTPEKRAEIQAKALEGRKRARARREVERGKID